MSGQQMGGKRKKKKNHIYIYITENCRRMSETEHHIHSIVDITTQQH